MMHKLIYKVVQNLPKINSDLVFESVNEYCMTYLSSEEMVLMMTIISKSDFKHMLSHPQMLHIARLYIQLAISSDSKDKLPSIIDCALRVLLVNGNLIVKA